ncbi:MAG: hypothetical protein ACI8W7_004832 [Gammaproteobacteria bacterium]|jgi:hypothetical protein
MAWVASLRLHEPDGVRNFQGAMTRVAHSGACGKGGRS